MYQPKSLAELARVAINKNIKARPHLMDLALPPRMIRELEEKFVEDHLDSEELAERKFYESLMLHFVTFEKSVVDHQVPDIDTMSLAFIMSYPEEKEVPFGYISQTVISEWATYTYAGRIYGLCHSCAVKQRGSKNHIVHYGKKSVCNESQHMRRIWIIGVANAPARNCFGQTKVFTQEIWIKKLNLCQK